jgi:hypothetical protein
MIVARSDADILRRLLAAQRDSSRILARRLTAAS